MPAIPPIPTSNSVPAQILMPTVGVTSADVKLSSDMNPIKRSHDEDDDYDN